MLSTLPPPSVPPAVPSHPVWGGVELNQLQRFCLTVCSKDQKLDRDEFMYTQSPEDDDRKREQKRELLLDKLRLNTEVNLARPPPHAKPWKPRDKKQTTYMFDYGSPVGYDKAGGIKATVPSLVEYPGDAVRKIQARKGRLLAHHKNVREELHKETQAMCKMSVADLKKKARNLGVSDGQINSQPAAEYCMLSSFPDSPQDEKDRLVRLCKTKMADYRIAVEEGVYLHLVPLALRKEIPEKEVLFAIEMHPDNMLYVPIACPGFKCGLIEASKKPDAGCGELLMARVLNQVGINRLQCFMSADRVQEQLVREILSHAKYSHDEWARGVIWDVVSNTGLQHEKEFEHLKPRPELVRPTAREQELERENADLKREVQRLKRAYTQVLLTIPLEDSEVVPNQDGRPARRARSDNGETVKASDRLTRLENMMSAPSIKTEKACGSDVEAIHFLGTMGMTQVVKSEDNEGSL